MKSKTIAILNSSTVDIDQRTVKLIIGNPDVAKYNSRIDLYLYVTTEELL